MRSVRACESLNACAHAGMRGVCVRDRPKSITVPPTSKSYVYLTQELGIPHAAWQMAAGKAPDMSQLDAGVCPYMEREVEAAGAKNQVEIRAAVKAAWAKLTDADCVKISKKVRSNMLKVIAQKGGNFFRG